MKKVCTACGKKKDRAKDFFVYHKKKWSKLGKDYRHSKCKTCLNKVMLKWREANRDKSRTYMREYMRTYKRKKEPAEAG